MTNFDEYKKNWFEGVKHKIKEKVKHSFIPNLSLQKSKLESEQIEGWFTPKGSTAKEKFRVYVAIVPDFIPTDKIRGLEDFDYIIKKPGWKIVTYKFVFNIRPAEFIEYLNRQRG